MNNTDLYRWLNSRPRPIRRREEPALREFLVSQGWVRRDDSLGELWLDSAYGDEGAAVRRILREAVQVAVTHVAFAMLCARGWGGGVDGDNGRHQLTGCGETFQHLEVVDDGQGGATLKYSGAVGCGFEGETYSVPVFINQILAPPGHPTRWRSFRSAFAEEFLPASGTGAESTGRKSRPERPSAPERGGQNPLGPPPRPVSECGQTGEKVNPQSNATECTSCRERIVPKVSTDLMLALREMFADSEFTVWDILRRIGGNYPLPDGAPGTELLEVLERRGYRPKYGGRALDKFLKRFIARSPDEKFALRFRILRGVTQYSSMDWDSEGIQEFLQSHL